MISVRKWRLFSVCFICCSY